ncbi:MAG: transposase [Planctomycetes bacterium]|nr:transposase [Planctomycetota bacterium]
MENKALRKSRHSWLENSKDMTAKQEVRLGLAKRLDSPTTVADQITLALANFWELPDLAEAASYLKRWSSLATHIRLEHEIQETRMIVYLIAEQFTFRYVC